jgi:predicted phage-related endonuclease
MMALNDEQKAFRSKVIGGSDVNIIMGGDDDKILHLWKLKRGEVQDEDLSDVLQVQMGVFTEPFNIQWFEKHTGRKVTDNGIQKVHPVHSFMGCTLDGMTDDGETVFEAKHVSAFSNAEEIQDRYMPQLYHNMSVCGVEKAVLSVFYGNHKWEKYDINRDMIYATIVEDAVEKFWACVQSGTPPVAIKSSTPVDAIRRVDMTGNNMWASMARQYMDNLAGKDLCDQAVEQLKKLVAEDVAEAWGHGIKFKRDKRGSLRIGRQ